MSGLPRLVLAAPASGAGKTTVATGLMAALAARGLRVSPHKVGPDYIDPSYHALATGRPGRNLDVVLCGAERIGPLLRHAAAGADIAVVEGVMGLFDGMATPGPGRSADHASTAHVARLLDAPVLLVVDARGAGRSVAALVAGFRDFDPRVRLAGVILNRVGSDRHRALLTDALGSVGVPVLGALPRDDGAHTPSRHLGLVPAVERGAVAADTVSRLGALVADGVDLDAVVRLAGCAPPLPAQPWDPADALARAGEVHDREVRSGEVRAGRVSPAPPTVAGGGDRGRPVRIAVAAGAAFTFGYTEHVELLTAAGAEVVTVDPLTDGSLPPGTDGLMIGGGFPEEHTGALSDNTPLRGEVAAFAAAGRPLLAECAGLLYLARRLDGAPMCGVLDVDAVMGMRLTLGYREATALHDSPLAAAGTAVTAHEFHRTRLVVPAGGLPAEGAASRAWRAWPAGMPSEEVSAAEGFVHAGVHASYLHLHWAGLPSAPLRLLAACAARRPGEG